MYMSQQYSVAIHYTTAAAVLTMLSDLIHQFTTKDLDWVINENKKIITLKFTDNKVSSYVSLKYSGQI